jgi:hypothetical protein
MRRKDIRGTPALVLKSEGNGIIQKLASYCRRDDGDADFRAGETPGQNLRPQRRVWRSLSRRRAMANRGSLLSSDASSVSASSIAHPSSFRFKP